MNKAVLMLGGNPLNYGIYCKWKKKGYMVYVADWNEQPAVRGDRHFQADVKDARQTGAGVFFDGCSCCVSCLS